MQKPRKLARTVGPSVRGGKKTPLGAKKRRLACLLTGNSIYE
jgi:hypothetical protein